VNDSQLSLAIGKQGLNVRLANRLADWNIDVKTVAQFEDMDIAAESRRKVSELFGDEEEYGDEYTLISQLPGVDPSIAAILKEHDKDFIEDFLVLTEEELVEIGLSQAQQESIRRIIEEHVEVEIVEEEEAVDEGAADSADLSGEEIAPAEQEEEDAASEEYVCPECGARITLEMTSCPNCRTELSFEYEDDNIEV